MPVLFDTDLLPARERREAVLDAYAGESPRRLVSVPDQRVRHRVERVDLGVERQLLRTGGSALAIIRTARQVRT